MAPMLFIVKSSSAQGEGGGMLGEWEERGARALEPFWSGHTCQGPWHALSASWVQSCFPVALSSVCTHSTV